MKKNSPDSVDSPLPPEIQAIADKLPPGHPYPRNLMMLMQACAEVQRENGLTPEGLEADYRKIHRNFFIYNVNGTPTTLPGQYTVFGNVGVYFADAKLQPFFRYEVLRFSDAINEVKNQTRFGGGLNFYILGQNAKITPYFERVQPNVQPLTAQLKDFNRFVCQFQGSF